MGRHRTFPNYSEEVFDALIAHHLEDIEEGLEAKSEDVALFSYQDAVNLFNVAPKGVQAKYKDAIWEACGKIARVVNMS